MTSALMRVVAILGLATAGLACSTPSGGTNQQDGGPVGTGSGGAGSGGKGSSGAGGSAAGGGGGAVTGAGGAGRGGASGSAGTGSGGTGAGGSVSSGGAGGAGGQGGAAGATGGAGGTAGAGGATNDPCGPSNPATVPLPTIPAGTFDITSNGAVGNGTTDNTAAVQAALNAASAAGGGTVVVPSGTFLSGPITIGSSTRLQLSAGAILRMLPRASYPSATTAFITSTGSTHDIEISGSGTIDGQGQDWWDAFAADSTISRPQEINLGHVTRIRITGIRLQNPPEEHIWVKSDTNVTITGITISTLAVSGKSDPKNTDGVDVTATGMFFCNNNIACGDDNIAMSGTNLYIGYSTFGVGHGCSIGSITQNGVSSVTVDHLTMNGTTSGIRMKSARDRGGLVQNLTYSNVTMTNVQNPVYITSYYPTLPTDPTTDTAMAVTATTPHWQNITIKNLTATGSTNGGILWGLPEAPISGLVFDNVSIKAKTGMVIYHATGVSFTNGSTVTPTSGAAVTVFDAAVTGITTTAF
jgi:polygalacturonase